jgi:hypothetical protein
MLHACCCRARRASGWLSWQFPLLNGRHACLLLLLLLQGMQGIRLAELVIDICQRLELPSPRTRSSGGGGGAGPSTRSGGGRQSGGGSYLDVMRPLQVRPGGGGGGGPGAGAGLGAAKLSKSSNPTDAPPLPCRRALDAPPGAWVLRLGVVVVDHLSLMVRAAAGGCRSTTSPASLTSTTTRCRRRGRPPR